MPTRLYAGSAVSNITPKLGSHMQGFFNDRLAEDVGDEIEAHALVLQNDDTAIAIVVCDIISCYKEYADMARQRAAELTGIPAENVFISCTHTHYGPTPVQLAHIPMETEWVGRAMEKAADAVKLAHNRLQPARVGHASGWCPEETNNRRWHMKDGSVVMHPPNLSPDVVRPAGPKDPEIPIAVFLDDDFQPIGVLANYPTHYIGVPTELSNTLSANFFGEFCRALQRIAGGRFGVVATNGCCGDVYYDDPLSPQRQPFPNDPWSEMRRSANMVAARAYGAWMQIRDFDEAPQLGAYTKNVDFTRRDPSPDELAAARALYESKNDPDDRDWIYAMELVKISAEPITRPTPVTGLRIGDVGIVGMGGEMFCDYGLQVKARSPFARTMTVELANDYLGYCPTDIALLEGSYETRLCTWAKAASGTEKTMVDACVEVLNRLI